MTRTPRHTLMSLDDAAERLIPFFPELAEQYGSEVERWQPEKPPAYVVYEDLFYPYIEELLASRDEATIRRVFDFVELLVTAEDASRHDLARIAILTPLTVDPAPLSLARQHMGPATRRTLRQVLRGLDR